MHRKMTRKQRIVSLCATVAALAGAVAGPALLAHQGTTATLADYHAFRVEAGPDIADPDTVRFVLAGDHVPDFAEEVGEI